MLKMIHGKAGVEEEFVKERVPLRMEDAAYPAPFASGLEYNSPAHGTWNIVHTGMLIPDSHQIYVCAANCNRGVVLTAAEMNAIHRFSTVAIVEEDLRNGQMEELVIDGVTEILEKLSKKPSVILLFTVCLHHFMGCDLPYIYEMLRKRFPKQKFVDCYMDPIMQKEGMTPDEKLRIGLYKTLEKRKINKKQVSILGNDLPIEETSEFYTLLEKAGCQVKDITRCKSFEEYLSLAESFLNITTYPAAKAGGEILSKRLSNVHLYLPATFDYEEIEREWEKLAGALGISPLDCAPLRERCEKELKKARDIIGDTPISIDANAAPRLLGLAKLLLTHGFSVVRLYVDCFNKEEEKEYLWLKQHVPDLKIYPTIHTSMRVILRTCAGKSLAIGQKAAYFTQTRHFVNMVEGGGHYGYDGICHLVASMTEAFLEEKDTKDLIIRKGLGCESCI